MWRDGIVHGLVLFLAADCVLGPCQNRTSSLRPRASDVEDCWFFCDAGMSEVCTGMKGEATKKESRGHVAKTGSVHVPAGPWDARKSRGILSQRRAGFHLSCRIYNTSACQRIYLQVTEMQLGNSAHHRVCRSVSLPWSMCGCSVCWSLDLGKRTDGKIDEVASPPWCKD